MKNILMNMRATDIAAFDNRSVATYLQKGKIPPETPLRAFIYCNKSEGKKEQRGKVLGEAIVESIEPILYYDSILYKPEGSETYEECGPAYWINVKQLNKTGLTYDEFVRFGKRKTVNIWTLTSIKWYNSSEVKTIKSLGYKKAPYNWAYIKIEIPEPKAIETSTDQRLQII